MITASDFLKENIENEFICTKIDIITRQFYFLRHLAFFRGKFFFDFNSFRDH